MPIWWLYATYHLLREPGNSIDRSSSVIFSQVCQGAASYGMWVRKPPGLTVWESETILYHGWWQLKHFLFSPRNLGKMSNLTNIFQGGWNHQLDTNWQFFWGGWMVGWWLPSKAWDWNSHQQGVTFWGFMGRIPGILSIIFFQISCNYRSRSSHLAFFEQYDSWKYHISFLLQKYHPTCSWKQ